MTEKVQKGKADLVDSKFMKTQQKSDESSSETDSEEEYEKNPNSDISHVLEESEDEKGTPEFIHRYTVEIIAEYKD